jgi:OmpA-OmpF porin, OOP family
MVTIAFSTTPSFIPYIGSGIGEATTVLNNTRFAGGLNTGPFGGNDAVLGYQGIAGVSYPIAPHLSMAAEYRYFATLRPGFQQKVAGQQTKISPSYAANDVLLRVVYCF